MLQGEPLDPDWLEPASPSPQFNLLSEDRVLVDDIEMPSRQKQQCQGEVSPANHKVYRHSPIDMPRGLTDL